MSGHSEFAKLYADETGQILFILDEGELWFLFSIAGQIQEGMLQPAHDNTAEEVFENLTEEDGLQILANTRSRSRSGMN